MKNPWLAKNPFMSMWLSGANSYWGAARGHAVAEAHRQSAAMMAEGTRQMMRFWSAVPTAAPTSSLAAPRRKKKSR